jgi:hypothetical protein
MLMARKYVCPLLERGAGAERLLHSMRDINWNYIGDAIPAFLTIIMIPLSLLTLPSCLPEADRGGQLIISHMESSLAWVHTSYSTVSLAYSDTSAEDASYPLIWTWQSTIRSHSASRPRSGKPGETFGHGSVT